MESIIPVFFNRRNKILRKPKLSCMYKANQKFK